MLTRSWLVLELTGSGAMLALAHVTMAAGSLAVAPISGVLADRFDRRTLLIASNLLMGTTFVGIGLLILFGWIATWHIIASAVIAGAGMSLQQTSSQAVVPSLVPREGIMNAVALHSTTMGINRVAGPAISGLLIAVVGTEGAYFAAAFALAFPIVLYALMRPLKVAQEGPKESFLASFKAGVRFVIHSPAIRMVMLVSVTTSGLAMPFLQLMPMYVTQVLHMGPSHSGRHPGAVRHPQHSWRAVCSLLGGLPL